MGAVRSVEAVQRSQGTAAAAQAGCRRRKPISDAELFYREMRESAGLPRRGRERPVEMERVARQRVSEDAEAYAALSDLVSGSGSF